MSIQAEVGHRNFSAEALLAGQNRILEMIATNAPLEETLTSLVLLIESQFEGMLCSVVLLDEDGKHMYHGAAPNLPDSYRKAIDGVIIGPTAGSCGTAMFRREPVIVTDLLKDPLYRELALRHGLRACWSTPIASHQGKILGSFAMYYREQKSPGSAEVQMTAIGTRLAGIAIERWQADLERRRAAEILVLDLAERKAKEQRLREFERVVEGVEEMILVIDRDYWYVIANQTFLRYRGMSREQVIGKKVADVLDPEFFERTVKERLDQCFQGKVVRYELRYPYPELGVRDLSASYFPIDGPDGISRAAVILQDITQRKQAQAQLEESEKRLRDVYERAPVGIAFVDSATGRFLWVNPRYCEIAGRTEDQMLQIDFQSITHPDDLGENLVRAQALANGEIPHLEMEKRYVRPDGSLVWVTVSAAPLGGQEQLRRCNLVMAQDISERKLLERQLLQAQKMESLGNLAGGIAHDFNNVLGVILGQGELLLQKLGPSDPSRRRVEQICQAGRRATLLTEQLLAFSRQQLLRPTTLNLNRVVEDFGNMLASLIGEDVMLLKLLDPEVGRVSADPGRIEQVLMNLVVNARDAMPAGGTITIRTSNMEMDEEFVRRHPGTKPGRCVVLTVSDTGSGMDAQTAARIFDPFFTTKNVDKGTGLGLSTVYGIVKQSGGHISVESALGEGSTFSIYLPRVEESAIVGSQEKKSATAARGKETILLVEDAAPLREVTREFLEEAGYSVLEAGDASEALATAERYGAEISLLITDVVLPGINGRTLAEQLVSRRPGTKVLYISGYTNDSTVRRGVLQSELAFLEKPFTQDALTHKVREILDPVA